MPGTGTDALQFIDLLQVYQPFENPKEFAMETSEETCPESNARCQEHSTAYLIRLTFSEWFDWEDDAMCEDTEMDRWNSAAPPQWRMCYWLGGYTPCQTSGQWQYEHDLPF